MNVFNFQALVFLYTSTLLHGQNLTRQLSDRLPACDIILRQTETPSSPQRFRTPSCRGARSCRACRGTLSPRSRSSRPHLARIARVLVLNDLDLAAKTLFHLGFQLFKASCCHGVCHFSPIQSSPMPQMMPHPANFPSSAREVKSKSAAVLDVPRMMWSINSNPSHSARDFNSSVNCKSALLGVKLPQGS